MGNKKKEGQDTSFTTFFSETGSGKYGEELILEKPEEFWNNFVFYWLVPRAVFVDLEPTVVGELST